MARARHLGYIDTRSTGAAIWEATHPGQVQAEYEAVGKPPPTYTEIMEQAVQDAISAGRESASNVAEAAGAIGSGAVEVVKFVAIAAGIAFILYALEKKKPKRAIARSKRIGRQWRRM